MPAAPMCLDAALRLASSCIRVRCLGIGNTRRPDHDPVIGGGQLALQPCLLLLTKPQAQPTRTGLADRQRKLSAAIGPCLPARGIAQRSRQSVVRDHAPEAEPRRGSTPRGSMCAWQNASDAFPCCAPSARLQRRIRSWSKWPLNLQETENASL